jgi:hypothetical protein
VVRKLVELSRAGVNIMINIFGERCKILARCGVDDVSILDTKSIDKILGLNGTSSFFVILNSTSVKISQ